MTTEPKMCFVIGPIGETGSPTRLRADKLLDKVIKPSLKGNYVIRRADELPVGTIIEQVIGQVIGADLVIANLTEHNPNAFYELAIRHMVDKPVIHMAERGVALPFNVMSYRAVMYSLDDSNIEAARQELLAQVERLSDPWFRPLNPITAAVQNLQRVGELSSNAKIKILIAGQPSCDRIVYPSGNDEDQLGGSVYYVTKAIQYLAHTTQASDSLFIDVWLPVSDEFSGMITTKFAGNNITKYPIEQDRTLRITNTYTNKKDWAQRRQEVSVMPDSSLHPENLAPVIRERLERGAYTFVLLLPLTPFDFADIDRLVQKVTANPRVLLGVELQGLLRDIPQRGGPVGAGVAPALPNLLRRGAIFCAHANIDEGLFLVEALARMRNVRLSRKPMSPNEIAMKLCEEGIKYVGLTDGGSGSWVAWQSKDGNLHSQYCPTPNIRREEALYVTGAGDTWFGVFVYMLLGRGFDPISAGLLATQFATLKCRHSTALGDQTL